MRGEGERSWRVSGLCALLLLAQVPRLVAAPGADRGRDGAVSAQAADQLAYPVGAGPSEAKRQAGILGPAFGEFVQAFWGYPVPSQPTAADPVELRFQAELAWCGYTIDKAYDIQGNQIEVWFVWEPAEICLFDIISYPWSDSVNVGPLSPGSYHVTGYLSGDVPPPWSLSGVLATTEFDFTVAPHPSHPLTTIGLHSSATSTFYLRDSNNSGPAGLTFPFGPAPSTWTPISGDWDGDADDSVGLYSPATGTFYVRNTNSAGPADLTFRFGPAPSTWLPIAGDWDGNGTETIGLYSAATGTFYLRNSNSAGVADLTFRFGPTGSAWLPVVGDWDGNETDTIGLYDPASGRFYLRSENAPGPADMTFRFGPTSSSWKPIAGDWNQDGIDTIGLYDPATGSFYLRNANSAGNANYTFRYGPALSTWLPIAGDWDGM